MLFQKIMAFVYLILASPHLFFSKYQRRTTKSRRIEAESRKLWREWERDRGRRELSDRLIPRYRETRVFKARRPTTAPLKFVNRSRLWCSLVSTDSRGGLSPPDARVPPRFYIIVLALIVYTYLQQETLIFSPAVLTLYSASSGLSPESYFYSFAKATAFCHTILSILLTDENKRSSGRAILRDSRSPRFVRWKGSECRRAPVCIFLRKFNKSLYTYHWQLIHKELSSAPRQLPCCIRYMQVQRQTARKRRRR